MRGRRRLVVPLAVVLAASLAGCVPALPESVVPGSEITVGWTEEFTSANAAASPTAGNIDIAETIRGDFGDVVDGQFVPDKGFGTVSIVKEKPFTVKYDLAEPKWSDGIPLDAADLMLGWAGASGYFDRDGGAGLDGDSPDTEQGLPSVDEFARSIEITFPKPDIGWQQAVTVPVPAHVVGKRAFGKSDAMEAKQAVIAAIEEHDIAALKKIAQVWTDGLKIPAKGKIPTDLLISSGPFLVDKVSGAGKAQSVTLVPNPSYRGLVTPKVARINLVPPGDDPVGAVGNQIDVVTVAPVAANWEQIHELERRDLTVDSTHDGTLWALLLRPVHMFIQKPARTAFLHAVTASAMIEKGAGVWASSYTGSTSMVSAPGTRAYDIVNEDSGFTETLGTSDDPALEREAAGVAAGSRVCVLYDRTSEFAVGAFAGLRETALEAGWDAVDCGSEDFDGALAKGAWDAVIARVPIPQTPAQIAAQWGKAGEASITGQSNPQRDELIVQLEQATDVYEIRDILGQIEATIVQEAVAFPIAANPRITIVDRDVTGISPRNGALSPLTYGVTQWAVVP